MKPDAPAVSAAAAATWPQRLLWAVSALAVLWCAHVLSHDLASVRWQALWGALPHVAAAAALAVLSFALRSVRWHIYLQAVRVRSTLAFSGLTYMAGLAYTVSPGKIGEVTRARYLLDRGGSWGTVSGAFVVERLLDLIILTAFGGVVLSARPEFRAVTWITLASCLALCIALVVLPWSQALARCQSQSMGQRLARAVLTPVCQAQVFLRGRLFTIGLLLGALAWACEGLAVAALVQGITPGDWPWWSVGGSFAVAIVVGALSFLPGGLGGTEVVMTGLLHWLGISLADALLITLVWRLVTLWLAVALGWAAVAWLSTQKNP